MKIFSAVFIFLILYAGCSSERVKPPIDANLNVKEMPSQESWNSEIFFSDSGKTKARLIAGHIRIFDKSRETLIDSSLKVDFYDRREVKTTTLTSKRGRVNDATKDLYAIDSVVAVNDSGITLKTEELMWRNRDRKIVSDKFVTIITPMEKIEGYGFESDQGIRNYVIRDITYITRRDSLK
jgi:LPS export ABC transporter protein LptC